MLIDFTEEELLVIGKLLAHVAANTNAYHASDKVQKVLGYELTTEDFDTVKFYNEDTGAEIQDYLYIKIEETV